MQHPASGQASRYMVVHMSALSFDELDVGAIAHTIPHVFSHVWKLVWTHALFLAN
jgi:hypothetical protein